MMEIKIYFLLLDKVVHIQTMSKLMKVSVTGEHVQVSVALYIIFPIHVYFILFSEIIQRSLVTMNNSRYISKPIMDIQHEEIENDGHCMKR